MRFLFGLICIVASMLSSQGNALAQEHDTNVENLKREIDLLRRENDLLKRENELLKKENSALKKGTQDKVNGRETDVVPPVIVDNVEYAYQGMTRSGATVVVTVLATSEKGDRQGPNGQMTLVDEDGEKYQGMPAGGFGLRPALREGVPVKLTWRFGPNPITGKSSAPSPKISRFPLLAIASDVGGGGDTIEFRNVPTVVAKVK